MKITVSGEAATVKDGITVAELIEERDVENSQYVTVTVNDDFINSGDFAEKTLADGDNVEFLYFMGGGR